MFNDDDKSLQAQEKAIQFVDEEMCRFYKILPIFLDDRGRVLTVAMADLSNVGAIDDLRSLLALDEVVGVETDLKKIEAAIGHYYSNKQDSIEDIIKSIENDKDLMDGRGIL